MVKVADVWTSQAQLTPTALARAVAEGPSPKAERANFKSALTLRILGKVHAAMGNRHEMGPEKDQKDEEEVECGNCDGTGKVKGKDCEKCKGKGTIIIRRRK